jgi:hypothetical protein
MKYLKMLGLAAVAAAALMAFLGAGTASAETTLCEKTEDPCQAANAVTAGETISASLAAGTKAVLTAGEKKVECSKSGISGKVATATTPTGNVAAKDLTWSECNIPAETVTGGTIGIHHHGAHNGTVTVKDFVVKTTEGFISCYWRPTAAATGTMTAGTPATIKFTDLPVELVDTVDHNSSAFCPASTGKWNATYQVTNPKSLFVSTGV